MSRNIGVLPINVKHMLTTHQKSVSKELRQERKRGKQSMKDSRRHYHDQHHRTLNHVEKSLERQDSVVVLVLD